MQKNLVFPEKPDALALIFKNKKPLIGMLHLPALPGAPRYKGESMEDITAFVLNDVRILKENGIDGLMVENGGDLPFLRPDDIGYETVCAMTAIAQRVKDVSGPPMGINCLANAVIASLAIAKASGAEFVRCNQWVNAYVANEGLLSGESAKAARYRAAIKAEDVQIFTDVHVKHGSHSIVADRTLADQTRDAVFFDADVLIATGSRTGDATPVEEITGIKDNTELPVIAGSGLTAGNAATILEYADGAVVGSWIKEEGKWWKAVDASRVRALVDRAAAYR